MRGLLVVFSRIAGLFPGLEYGGFHVAGIVRVVEGLSLIFTLEFQAENGGNKMRDLLARKEQ